MLMNLFLLIVIFKNIIPKTIIITNNIINGRCEYEKGIYSFTINAILKGNLSHSMIEKYTIKNSINNNNNFKIICKFPEEKDYVKNKTIEIKCYTDITDNIPYTNIIFF